MIEHRNYFVIDALENMVNIEFRTCFWRDQRSIHYESAVPTNWSKSLGHGHMTYSPQCPCGSQSGIPQLTNCSALSVMKRSRESGRNLNFI